MEDNKIQGIALLKNHKGSARKARLVLDMIRGKKVGEARNMLQFSNKRMATPILKLLNSACANVTFSSPKVDIENFIVFRAFADGGQHQKRFRFRAKGSGSPVLKRSCHITLSVADKK